MTDCTGKNDTVLIKPIGIIRSGHCDLEKIPIQPVFAEECEGTVEIFPDYADGLKDLEGFSHIILLYHFHRAGPVSLNVKPFLDDSTHGVFATRSPCRPNALGLSIVRLIARDGPVLSIRGVDILDRTPLIDIKPYSGIFDCFPNAKNGWQEKLDENTVRRRGRRGYIGGDPGKS